MDGFLQIKRMEMMGTSRKGNSFITTCLIFILIACNENKQIENRFYQISTSIVGEKVYYQIYKNAIDSIQLWNKNDLTSYWIRYSQKYKLDSLMCFNKNANRFIGCIQRYRNEKSPSDELLLFFGEKINNSWYFFRTASVTIPREFYIKSSDTPLSYQQLHQIALKEVYGGYLNNKGEINEAWFTHQFEGSGWGAPNYKGAKSKQDSAQIKDWYYKLQHARQNLRVWNSVRKVCSIYKLEDLSIDYNNTTKKIAVRFPVRSYESTFLFNDYYSYSYSINDVFVKLIEYNKLSPTDTSLKFNIKNIPSSCKLNLMVYLSEVGPLNFELEISNGKIISKKLKECLPKNSV